MNDDDIILSDLRRRIEAVSIERDNATLALCKVREEEDKKRSRLRSEVSALHAEVVELRRRVKSRDQELIRERDEARRETRSLSDTLIKARRYYRALLADYRALKASTLAPKRRSPID